MTTLSVLGQIGLDLVLEAEHWPEPGDGAAVRRRRLVLGGKGANQAVAARRMGAAVELHGVVGDDDAGARALASAREDGIGVEHVIVRDGAATALHVAVLDGAGGTRLLEHIAPASLLRVEDLAPKPLRAADAVLLQLRQPEQALLRAIEHARGLLVADGAPSPAELEMLLERGAVLRADAAEARALLGRRPADADDARHAARVLVDRGAALVAVAVEDADVAVWADGSTVLPHHDRVVDATGGGDAFTAVLATALVEGADPEHAARLASAAAALAVGTVGARPQWSRADVEARASGR